MANLGVHAVAALEPFYPTLKVPSDGLRTVVGMTLAGSQRDLVAVLAIDSDLDFRCGAKREIDWLDEARVDPGWAAQRPLGGSYANWGTPEVQKR